MKKTLYLPCLFLVCQWLVCISYFHTHNPIQIFSICYGGHYGNFPMYFYSMAKAFQINATNSENNVGLKLPVNLTVLMDPGCYNALSRCIPTMQNYFPFNVIQTHELDYLLALENVNTKRFAGALFKMHLSKIHHFDALDYLMVIDIDCGIYHRFEDLWKAVTSRHEISHSNAHHTEHRHIISYTGLKEEKLLWAALEFSNHSSDHQFQYPEVVNAFYLSKNKKHYYPPTGINTGVMIWNLQLMRRLNLSAYDFIANNTEEVLLADQDYLNSWAYFHQDRIGLFNCKYNVHKDGNCIGPVIQQGEEEGKVHYLDLFNTPEQCVIFHANGGFTRRGQGRNIAVPFRSEFFEMCGYWTPP
jgi:hypothetical protein